MLYQLHRRHMLVQVGRCLYRLPSEDGDDSLGLAACMSRVPRGVVCLQSALHLHSMVQAAPECIWMGIESRAWKPSITGDAVRYVRMSETTLMAGVDVLQHSGVDVRVTNPSKTVVDCFKYRNKIGEHVAIESLRTLLRTWPDSERELIRYCTLDRVDRVIRPYLAALRGPKSATTTPTLASVGAIRTEILAIAAAKGMTNLRVFGSVARGDSNPESDLDVLVTCGPQCSLFDMIDCADTLAELIGRKVDIISDRSLDRSIAEDIRREAVPL
ncbi:MAG: nucleotidyltransferase domain-containing protein [Phycisphaerales bacterium]|nr:nucleotidyltransferase domain-containing protein [Phycisphaerales bacterium]